MPHRKSISVYEAKARLSRLIRDVEKDGSTVTICRHGSPVADLVAHRHPRNRLRQSSRLRGAVFHGDPSGGTDEKDWPARLR